MNQINLKINTFLLGILILSSISCKKFLDAKPDQKLVVPTTMQDCQALIDNTQYTNGGYGYDGECSTDDYYLVNADYTGSASRDRQIYTWESDAIVNNGEYSGAYIVVLYANQVIAALDLIKPAASEQAKWNELRGDGLFNRAQSFFNLASLFCQPYDAATAKTDLGIPLRLTPNITDVSDRGTVQQTYDRILADLNGAVELLPANLPNTNITKSRPTKAAAYAMLARVYLSMRDYVKAGVNANASLAIYSSLMNYNSLTASAANPIAPLNTEIMFELQSAFSLSTYYGYVDSNLYKSYAVNDLRRTVFFQDYGGGLYKFKGTYSNQPPYIMECGLTTDEMYLTRAECSARAGDKTSALKDLNDLLRTRWVTGTYTDITAADADGALVVILNERRKELLFRGTRWTDLRRLNKEPRFAITLTRIVNGQTYTLPPNDLRYVLLIPPEVFYQVSLPQNPR